jgi:hypothetical protein
MSKEHKYDFSATKYYRAGPMNIRMTAAATTATCSIVTVVVVVNNHHNYFLL